MKKQIDEQITVEKALTVLSVFRGNKKHPNQIGKIGLMNLTGGNDKWRYWLVKNYELLEKLEDKKENDRINMWDKHFSNKETDIYRDKHKELLKKYAIKNDKGEFISEHGMIVNVETMEHCYIPKENMENFDNELQILNSESPDYIKNVENYNKDMDEYMNRILTGEILNIYIIDNINLNNNIDSNMTLFLYRNGFIRF